MHAQAQRVGVGRRSSSVRGGHPGGTMGQAGGGQGVRAREEQR